MYMTMVKIENDYAMKTFKFIEEGMHFIESRLIAFDASRDEGIIFKQTDEENSEVVFQYSKTIKKNSDTYRR